MEIRARTEDDIAACVALARVVQRTDAYPPHLPDDLPQFVVAPEAWAAWVADVGGEVAGHVVLSPKSSEPVMRLATEATGLPVEQVGVVARLFVAPDHRRKGMGRALLAAATEEAVRRGLCPVLDVGTRFHAAIALYEGEGWTRLGEVEVEFAEQVLHEFVYAYGTLPNMRPSRYSP